MELTASQITEIVHGQRQIVQGFKNVETQLKDTETIVQRIEQDHSTLRAEVDRLRKTGLSRLGGSEAVNPAAGRFVSNECARHLAAIVILGTQRLGKLEHINAADRDAVVARSAEIVGLETRAALTSSDIPLPTDYASQVVELVWQFGQARKYCTVYPLGTGTVKLPKLTTSPTFGFLAASASVPEKSPQFAFVTFTAQKAGGIVRIPAEIDVDSIVPLGQFLARYIARETARWEDTVMWLADGSGTYQSMVGIAQNAVTNGYYVQASSGNTAPSQLTLANFRALRTKIDPAALPGAAYYLNATMEALLVSFNTSATVTPYIANGANGPTLDGFPVRWVGVLPVYDTAAHVSQLQGTFGDASFYYLGERSGIRVETSKEVYFATDELAVRALERFVVASMADKANAALQLAAS